MGARRAPAPDHAPRAVESKEEDGDELRAKLAHSLKHSSPRQARVRIFAVPRPDNAHESLVVRVAQPARSGDRDRLHAAADPESKLPHLSQHVSEPGADGQDAGAAGEAQEGRPHSDGAQVGVALCIALGSGAVRLGLDERGEGGVEEYRNLRVRALDIAAEDGVDEEGERLHNAIILASLGELVQVGLGKEI